jgi:hypothetical protein
VSTELVYELLPVDWVLLLEDLRSKSVEIDGAAPQKLEKFSSMGNGFTFELESLIFWALLTSVQELLTRRGTFGVYGDDLICCREAAPDVVYVLNQVGFTVNETKSFFQGLFYESCGKHYFNDQEVTPVYQKEYLSEAELVRCHNRLVRWAARVGTSDPRACFAARRLASGPTRSCVIPYGSEADDGFLVSATEIVTRALEVDPNRGYRVRVLKFAKRSFPGNDAAFLALAFEKSTYRVWDPVGYLDSPRKGYEGEIDFVSDREVREEQALYYGRRWVIPLGVCPLKPR